MVPKTGPHSGSPKVRFWCYLLHLSKVRRLRNGPHFGSCLKTSFAQNTKTWGNTGCPKIGAEKRSPSAKISTYLRIRRLPDSPLARPEQETIWATTATTTATVAAAVAQCWFFLLNVVFFCSMLMFAFKIVQLGMRPAKKGCCSLLESRGPWSDTPWAMAQRISKSGHSSHCSWVVFSSACKVWWSEW